MRVGDVIQVPLSEAFLSPAGDWPAPPAAAAAALLLLASSFFAHAVISRLRMHMFT